MSSMTSYTAVLKTLLMSDVVDSTRWVEQLGEQQAARLSPATTGWDAI